MACSPAKQSLNAGDSPTRKRQQYGRDKRRDKQCGRCSAHGKSENGRGHAGKMRGSLVQRAKAAASPYTVGLLHQIAA